MAKKKTKAELIEYERQLEECTARMRPVDLSKQMDSERSFAEISGCEQIDRDADNRMLQAAARRQAELRAKRIAEAE